MHGFLGAFGASSDCLDSTARLFDEPQLPNWLIRKTASGSTDFATYGANEASAMGYASRDQVQIVVLGAIAGPFPAELPGSPLDDSTKTAEALLARYLEQGNSFLDGVVGSYCVLIVDGRDDSILLARDPYGGPRLYVHEAKGEVYFSTRLVDFYGLLESECQLDRSLEDFFLGYEFLPDNRTLLRDVKLVDNGSLLRWHQEARSEHKIRPFETNQELLEKGGSLEETEVIDALHTAFLESLKDLCPSSGKIGVLMGGFDSMLIAALLRGIGREVETFTFRYQESGYTQEFVNEFVQLSGVTHHWVDITPAILLEGLENYAYRFNQPVGQAHYVIATAEVARVMKERGIRHCITGDGCDGLFLGYPTVAARAKLIQTLSSVRGVLAPLIIALGSSRQLEQWLGHPYRFARNIGRILKRPQPARGHIAACALDKFSLGLLRSDQPVQDETPEQVLVRLAQGLEEVQPFRLAYMGKGRVGLNSIKLEGATRSSGITFLSPYMHPRMAAVAGKIPDELNRPKADQQTKDSGKYIFMAMVDKHAMLPAKFVHQRKMSPVTAPVDLWYWGPLRERVIGLFSDLPFQVNRDYTASLVTRKGAEQWFRKNIGISKYVNQATSLLASYAAFNRVGRSNK